MLKRSTLAGQTGGHGEFIKDNNRMASAVLRVGDNRSREIDTPR